MKPSSLIQSIQTALLFVFACGGMALHAQSTNTPPASASAPTSSSLVSNGNFESTSKNPSWPDDWPKAKGVTWETENGAHFLHIVADQPDQHLMVYREIAIPAGVKNLQITIRYRTSGVHVGSQQWYDARAIFHFLNDSRKQVTPDPKVMVFSKEASAWTEVSEPCVVPDGATKLVLMPSLYMVQAGTLDLAEISVTVTP